jgi:type IV secretion system protein VirB5
MKAFKRGRRDAVAPPRTTEGDGPGQIDSPYLAAQEVWIERYGSYVSSAFNWRLLAMLQAVALVVCIIGLLYIAGQNRFVPYVVAIDKVGMAIAVHPADQASPVDPRVIRAELANFVVNARSVVTDRVVEKYYLDNVYSFVPASSAAKGFLDSYYPGNSPFDRAQSGTVSVSIIAILPVSTETYEVQWTETLRNLQGKVTGTQQWDGTFGIAVSPPTDEQAILKNPIGLAITSINWVRKL